MDFQLRDVESLPTDGAWHTLPPQPLSAVTERGLKSKRAAQGLLELRVAWVQPSAEELEQLCKKRSKRAETSKAVSYTHLTLPTILLV